MIKKIPFVEFLSVRHALLVLTAIWIGSTTMPHAIASDWVIVAEVDEARFEFQVGSFKFSKTKGGDLVGEVTGRVIQTQTSNIVFRRWYVPLKDCLDERGKVYSLDLSGDYRHENTFLFGGGSVASGIAETICALAIAKASSEHKKGI